MSLFSSLLKLFFLHVPKFLFQIVGIIRVLNRGKRAFRKALNEEGLPDGVVDTLTEEFFIDIDWLGLIFGRKMTK